MTKTLAEGLHLERDQNGYWNVKQTSIDKVLLRTKSEEEATDAAKKLADIAGWEVDIDVLSHLQAKRHDLYQQIMKITHEYNVDTAQVAKDHNGYVTYVVSENEKEKTVEGIYITNGLCVHQENQQEWTIDHVPSKNMLSVLSSKEKAVKAAEAMKNLFIWSDIYVPDYILESSTIRTYLKNVRQAVENDTSIPELPEEIKFEIIFMQNESIRGNWDVFKQNWTQLNNLIGLDHVKEQIRQLLDRVPGMMRNKGKVVDKANSMHMLFAGPAGTGKTEVARILSRLFFALGYLKNNVCIETDRAGIVGSHIGQTEQNMTRLIQEAMGGVLFIDEAYALASEEGSNDFGREAVNVLIKAMEDNRGEFIVILAGYDSDMEHLMETNQGFRSRIRHKVQFMDYTPAQLTEIGMMIMTSIGYKCPPDVKEQLKKAIDGKMNQGVLEGNARGVRNITENVIDQTLIRIGKDNSADSLLILPEDVRRAMTNLVPKHEQEGLKEIQKQALKQLEQLIGMAELKSEVASILNQINLEKIKLEKGLITEKPRLHMIFSGPAGTGKTTVAKIIGKFLKGSGVLSNGNFKKVSRADLVAGYVGQTAAKVRKVVDSCKGGVMLIDEAYNLVNGDQDTFGEEAVAELIDLMEERKDDLVVILAGYEGDIEELLKTNEGFTSRIPYHFRFPNYTAQDIIEITTLHLKNNHLLMDEGALVALKEVIFEKAEQTEGIFDGNGRWASNFVDRVKRMQANRLSSLGDEKLAELNDEEFMKVIASDIKQAI